MFLVAGLGNPGEECAGNRHNLGFMVVDEVGRRLGVTFRPTKCEALIADVVGEDSRLLLVKPQTFMNMSGRSLKLIRSLFSISLTDILVIHDDLDIPFGEIRLKEDGGSAGHNGLESVIDAFGSREFVRLRAGIGRPPGDKDPADFVLENFTKAEKKELDFIVGEAADIILKTADNRS